MEIVDKFGISPVLLVAQFINFGIIFLVLKKFLYKPVMTMLKTRRDEIKKGIDDAGKAQILLEEASQKEKKLLKNAQNETRKMLGEAKKHTQMMLQDARENAKKEADRILKAAKMQIELEAKQTEKRLATHVSDLAVIMLTKSLPELLSENERTNVVKLAAKKLKGKVN